MPDDVPAHKRPRPRLRRFAFVPAIALALHAAPSSADEARSKVTLNGEVIQVHFNDGDSFRVLTGTYKGAKARLFGYNTLESYGPVHQWGDWTAKELYAIAKMATLFARRGVWECKTDGKTDTYGRMLVNCPKLAEEQIRRGYAHAMTVTDDPSEPHLLAAQDEAKAAARGIWAHGIPGYVLTSLHSVEEDTSGHGTYNRLVSSEDGHSVMWRHTNRYRECDNVCHQEHDVDEGKVDEAAVALRHDQRMNIATMPLDDDQLRAVIREYIRYHHVSVLIKKEHRDGIRSLLEVYDSEGKLGPKRAHDGACMIHVPFTRRFGGGKATCLK